MSSSHGILLPGRSRAPPEAQFCLVWLIARSLLNISMQQFADTTLATHSIPVFPKIYQSGCLLGRNISTERPGPSWQQQEPSPPMGEQRNGLSNPNPNTSPGAWSKEGVPGKSGLSDERRAVNSMPFLCRLSSPGLHGLPWGHLADGLSEECNELCRWEVPRSGCSPWGRESVFCL